MKQPLKKMTNEIRDKIKLYSKKQIDIADLISGYDINNEDLSYSYISHLDMTERDISNCNFTRSSVKLLVSKGVARNCNFSFANVLPGSSFVWCDCRKSNFGSSNCANINFSYADLRDVNACNATFTLFSKCFYRAKFSSDFLVLISRFLDVEGLPKIENIQKFRPACT